jgi:dipeptidyl aminopeptidase/acylaminoacyl peptidase
MNWWTEKYTGPESRRQPRWRPRPVRVIAALLLIAAIGYGAAVLYLVTQETRIVFEARQTLGEARPSFPYERIDVPRTDGAGQFAWIMGATPSSSDLPWVLFLHGNAATIAAKVNIAHYAELRKLGLNVMAPEYHGFGGLDGLPTESVLAADAQAAYDYLRMGRRVPASRVVIYGWSLGSAVAVTLASEAEAGALILEGAPSSLIAVGQQQYPFFPIRLIMRNPFESIQKINRVRAPILFLHSPEDAVIPIAEGRRLYDAAPADKTFVEVRGGHVDATTADTEHFYGAIRSFLIAHRVLPAEEGASGSHLPR